MYSQFAAGMAHEPSRLLAMAHDHFENHERAYGPYMLGHVGRMNLYTPLI